MRFLSEYSPEDPQPLGAYAGLSAAWAGLVTGFVVAHRKAGRPLPSRVPAGDLALLTTATYKLSRLITKDRVASFARAPFTRYQGDAERPSEVSEEARGTGLQRSIGELLVCPYCISQWVAAGLLAAYGLPAPGVERGGQAGVGARSARIAITPGIAIPLIAVVHPHARRSFANPAFSSRSAWLVVFAEFSSTTPSQARPRLAVATRHGPDALV
jgi:hypothetical protein